MASIDPSLISDPNEQKWVDEISKILSPQHHINIKTPDISVFQVPEIISTTKPEAYVPQQIGLGPNHHFRPQPYKKMEQKKLAVVRKVLDHHKIKDFELTVLDKVRKIVPVVRDCYDLFLQDDDDSLAWILAIDGLFLLGLLHSYNDGMLDEEQDPALRRNKELDVRITLPMKTVKTWDILRLNHAGATKEASETQKPLIEINQKKRLLAQDLLMAENQIPFIVLKEIDEALHPSSGTKLSPWLFQTFTKIHSPLDLCSASVAPEHLLDYMYHSIVGTPEKSTLLVVETPEEETTFVETPEEESTLLVVETPQEESTLLFVETPEEESTLLVVETPQEESTFLVARNRQEESTLLVVESPREESTLLVARTPQEESTLLVVESPQEESTLLVESPQEEISRLAAVQTPQHTHMLKEANSDDCISVLDAFPINKKKRKKHYVLDSPMKSANRPSASDSRIVSAIHPSSSLDNTLNFVKNIPKDEISRLYKQSVSTLETFSEAKIPFPSASKLHRAGYMFYKKPTISGVDMIDIIRKYIRLPCATLNIESEVTLRNLVAYETSMIDSDHFPLAEYLGFMCALIVDVEDVKLLQENDIIKGDLEVDEVTKLFTGMSNCIPAMKTKDKSDLQVKIEEVRKDYESRRTMKIYCLSKRLAHRFLVALKGMGIFVKSTWRIVAFIVSILTVFMLTWEAYCNIYGCNKAEVTTLPYASG